MRACLVDQSAFVDAAVVRFVMFEAEVRDVIAEGVEKVIVAVVMRAEKFLRLVDQILIWSQTSGGASSAAALSAAMSISVGGSCCQRNNLQEFSGDDGESTSVVSETGVK